MLPSFHHVAVGEPPKTPMDPCDRVKFILGVEEEDGATNGTTPHQVFTELDELCMHHGQPVWKETARLVVEHWWPSQHTCLHTHMPPLTSLSSTLLTSYHTPLSAPLFHLLTPPPLPHIFTPLTPSLLPLPLTLTPPPHPHTVTPLPSHPSGGSSLRKM